MRRLYTGTDTALIEYLREQLENRGFGVYVRNPTNTGSAAGELSPIMAPPELWLTNSGDFAAAERVLRQALTAVRPQRTDSWRCPQCGELVEGQFEICWRCGTPRPAQGENPN